MPYSFCCANFPCIQCLIIKNYMERNVSALCISRQKHEIAREFSQSKALYFGRSELQINDLPFAGDNQKVKPCIRTVCLCQIAFHYAFATLLTNSV